VASSSNQRATSAALEAQTPGGVRLGMIGGHNRDRMRGQGQADVDSYHVGLYGGGMLGAVALRGGLAVARQDVAAQRFVAFARFADGLASRYRAMTSQMFGEAAWRIGAVEPFVTLAHVRLNVGRGQERGRGGAATGGGPYAHQLCDGRHAGETQVALGGTRLAVRGSLGWRYAFGDQLPVVQAALDGQRFAVAGLPIARNSLVGDVRLHGAIRDRVQLSLGYQGAMARGGRNHGMQAGLNWRF
jgi:outer membrane autotransporter protein